MILRNMLVYQFQYKDNFIYLLMQGLNLEKQTLLEVSSLSSQSLGMLLDRKKQYLVISEPKSIRLYNMNSQKFQDQLKAPNHNSQITCVAISDDLFFFAYSTHVAASSSSSKIIFDFDTYLSDKIDRIHVIGYYLWIISGNILNTFLLFGSQLANKQSRKVGNGNNKVQDIHSHVFDEKIVDSLAVQDEFSKHYLILLLSNNQIICYEDKQTASFKTKSPCTSVIRYQKQKQNRYLVGCTNGEILCLEISKKKIKELWKISNQQSKGKVNLLVQVKNYSFIAFKDEVMQIWGQDKGLAASQGIDKKFVCSLYIQQRQTLIAGTSHGGVIQMRDYAQMIKDYKNKNKAKQLEQRKKQIEKLRKEYEQLKQKLKKEKKVEKIEKFEAEIDISIDYEMFCSKVEVQSRDLIRKIILKGKIKVFKNEKVTFEDYQKESNTFIIEEEGKKSLTFFIEPEQVLNKNEKIKAYIYLERDGKVFTISKIFAFKIFPLYQKVSPFKHASSNQLKITGGFKYFQLTGVITSFFIGLTNLTSNTNQIYYQSIITEDQIKISYANQMFVVQSESPVPLVLIRQSFMQFSKEKNISLNHSIQLSTSAIQRLIKRVGKMIKPLQKLKKEAQLIPSLLEAQKQEILSPDLKQILGRKQQILKKEKQSQRTLKLLSQEVQTIYVYTQRIKDHEVSNYEMDFFCREISQFDPEKISGLILK